MISDTGDIFYSNVIDDPTMDILGSFPESSLLAGMTGDTSQPTFDSASQLHEAATPMPVLPVAVEDEDEDFDPSLYSNEVPETEDSPREASTSAEADTGFGTELARVPEVEGAGRELARADDRGAAVAGVGSLEPAREIVRPDHPAWMGVGVLGGVALGATFGGPVGAGVGAVAGLAAGVVRTYTGKHTAAHAATVIEHLDGDTVLRLAQQIHASGASMAPPSGLGLDDLRAISDVAASGAEVK